MISQTFTSYLAKWKGNRTNVVCGQLCGVDEGTFGIWLVGQSIPSSTRRMKVAKVLGISPAEIEALIAADRIRGMIGCERVGVTIETIPQTNAWIDQQASNASEGV